jgi:hypothetical protein
LTCLFATAAAADDDDIVVSTNCLLRDLSTTACQTCEKLDHKIRCPLFHWAPQHFEPGDVHDMFQRIATDPHYQQYNPVVLSQPVTEEETQTSAVVPLFRVPGDSPPRNDPWLIALENFLTPEECDRLIYLAGIVGYKQSSEFDAQNFDGTYKGKVTENRESHQAWCFQKK